MKRQSLNENENKCLNLFGDKNTHKIESTIKKSFCENGSLENEKYMTTYGLLIDRSIQNPYVVFKSKPYKFMYTFTDEDKDKAKEYGMKIDRMDSTCVIMEPMERNTGAIGYLSNKEDLDVVTIVTNAGMINYKGAYIKMKSNILIHMTVFKKNLKLAIENKLSLNISAQVINENKSLLSMIDLGFKKVQSWTAYMGYNSKSEFK